MFVLTEQIQLIKFCIKFNPLWVVGKHFRLIFSTETALTGQWPYVGTVLIS